MFVGYIDCITSFIISNIPIDITKAIPISTTAIVMWSLFFINCYTLYSV